MIHVFVGPNLVSLDCPTNRAHFDMSPEAGNVVDGGLPAGQGAGFTAVTYRKVSCGFTTNVLVQVQPQSTNFFVRLLIAKHNVPLKSAITLQESGRAAVSLNRTTFGFWDYNPTGAGGAAFPITVTLQSIYGDSISFQVAAISTAVIDTGAQFPDPPAGTGGGESGCPGGVCPKPIINNGQTVIFEDSQLPQQSGIWVPLTSAAWTFYSGSLTPVSSPTYQGTRSGQVTLDAFGEVHLGCNVRTPTSEVRNVSFAVRTDSGTGKLSIWSGAGAHVDLSPDPVSTSWTEYSFQISGNANVPDPWNDLQIQNGNTKMTYYFDSFYFNFAASSAQCSPWYYSQDIRSAATHLVAGFTMVVLALLL
jgi:hypothetical protein